jgi:aspartyl-tRNA(Asn)/glutamyl-tRNA(Gln) amidotransferase subunit B
LAPGEKETAGWDEARGVTVVQRRKEEAADYRYFPEPDLVPVVVDAAWRERVRAETGELPAAQRVRLAQDYGLSDYDIGVLTQQGRATVAYFEDTAKRCGDAKAASNWVTNRVLASLKEHRQEIEDFPLTAERLAGLIAEQKASGLNKQAAEAVYNRMLESGGPAKEAIAHLGIKAVDAGALEEIVRRMIAANPKAVAEYKKGKTAAAQSFMGAVMRETKGAAKADVVQKLIVEELQKL